jgi:hypothetical protein
VHQHDAGIGGGALGRYQNAGKRYNPVAENDWLDLAAKSNDIARRINRHGGK